MHVYTAYENALLTLTPENFPGLSVNEKVKAFQNIENEWALREKRAAVKVFAGSFMSH